MVQSLDVRFSQYQLVFQAQKIGEKLTQTLIVTNQISDQILEGYWEVVPHPNDPPFSPNFHPWIEIKPQRFTGNQVKCLITVDTGQLQAGKTGEREILLQTNSLLLDHHIIPLKIVTTPLSLLTQKIPYGHLLSLMIAVTFGVFIIFSIDQQMDYNNALISGLISIVITILCGIRLLIFPGKKKFKLALKWAIVGMTVTSIIAGGLGVIIGGIDGSLIGGILGGYVAIVMIVSLVTIAQLDEKFFQQISLLVKRIFFRSILGFITGIILYFGSIIMKNNTIHPLLFVLWCVGITHLIFGIKSLSNLLKNREFNPSIARVLPLIVTSLGLLIAIHYKTSFFPSLIQVCLWLNILFLGGILFWSELMYHQRLKLTQKKQEKLILL